MISLSQQVKCYNLHDLLTFKVYDKQSIICRFFSTIDLEYNNFRSEDISKPDFTIYLGDFSPSNQGCHVFDNKYYVKKNYFFCEDSYKYAKWKFEINGFEGSNTEVRISANFFSGILISGFVVDSLINFKLCEKGYALTHSSCVSKENSAYLFTAQGGGGKTSTAAYAVENGFDFMGDNFTILDNGYVRSFLSPLNIFSFNLLPFIYNNMNMSSKIEFHIKNMIYNLIGLRIVTKINPKEVFPDSLTHISKLDSVFLLIPNENFGILEMSKEELIQHMVANMKLDSIPFVKYMMEYSYLFPDSKIAAHWDAYEGNLRSNLGHPNIYRVSVPQIYDQDTFKRIWKMIQRAMSLKGRDIK